MMAQRKKSTSKTGGQRARAKKRRFEEHPNFRERGSLGRFVKQPTPAPGTSAVAPTAQSVAGAMLGGLDRTAELNRLAEEAERMPFTELGATGLRHYAGFLDEEFLPALRGTKAIQVYTEMRENDPTVGAMLFAVEMLMRNVEWRVKPGGEAPADLEVADFVDSCRGDMADTWHDTLGSIFSFLAFGFSVHEEVYKRRDGHHPLDPQRNSRYADGRIGWRKLPVRAQDTIYRWLFDESQGDELRGLIQQPPPTYTYRAIPATRFLLFRTTAAKGNPQGRSILRNAYRPWYFKRRIEEIEAIGVERDLAGLPMMEVPAEMLAANASAELKANVAEIRRMLRDVRRDEREGILVPREFDEDGNSRYSFDLVRSGGRRQIDTTQIVNRYDRLIASVALADFILLGQQRVGSFALSESKTELFGTALGAWLDSVAEVFNRVAIPRLLLMNGLRVERPPELIHGDVETIDLSELGDFISKLAGAGMPIFPDPDIENALRMQAGLPEKKEEEETASAPAPTEGGPPGAPAESGRGPGETGGEIGT